MAGDSIPSWAFLVAKTLLRALRERDPYTYAHCCRVARNARLLAQAAGLSHSEQRLTEFSSIFHDLGKIGIPDTVLLKPSRLSAQEESLMRLHPIKSVEILSPIISVPFFKSMVQPIRHHHERIDGEGYPDRIKSEEIPLISRIILIADTYDAMTTNRPYRQGMASEVAYKELKLFSGRQFDSALVQIFLKAHPTWEEMPGSYEEEFAAEIIPLKKAA